MLNIVLFVLFLGNCCDSDQDILESISKSEKQFYSKQIVPTSSGHKVDKISYQSIIKRKAIVREQVLRKIKEDNPSYTLTSFKTFYLAEGADGAYAYGYIWSGDTLYSYYYDPLKGSISIENLDKNYFFESHEGVFLSQVSNWGEELKQKPIWSNPSLMGGLCYFVTKVDLSGSKCIYDTIGLYEFR